MVRDAVANMVNQLRERGYAPRKVGHNSWESRCPGHRSSDHALSITRNEFNHVVLECRSAENCQHIRIVRALGFTNEHVYAETPDWVISRLSHVEIHRAESKITDVPDDRDHGLASVEHCWRPLPRGRGCFVRTTAGFSPRFPLATAPRSSFERRNEGRIITLKSERVPIMPPQYSGKNPETR
jgi:hypothetical protein